MNKFAQNMIQNLQKLQKQVNQSIDENVSSEVLANMSAEQQELIQLSRKKIDFSSTEKMSKTLEKITNTIAKNGL